MTSRDVISSLNEHLLNVLRVEKGRSQDCEKMRSEIQRVQQKFSVVIHQQVVCKNLKPQFLKAQNTGLCTVIYVNTYFSFLVLD